MQKQKNKKIVEKVRVRFKAWWTETGESSLIFGTEQEANEWIARLADPSGVIEVKHILGVIVNQSARVGMLAAINDKVWVPLEEAER